MGAWGDHELLVELLDRQFAVLDAANGTTKLIRLRRVLEFVEGDAQLSAIIYDTRLEAERVATDLAELDAAVRAALMDLWRAHGEVIKERLSTVTDGALTAYGTLEDYAAAVQTNRLVDLTRHDLSSDVSTKRLVDALQHWWKWVTDIEKEAPEPIPAEMKEAIGPRLADIDASRKYVDRSIEQARRSLAWCAYRRLDGHRELLNPRPPQSTDMLARLRFLQASEFADVIGSADDGDVGPVNDADVDSVYTEINEDSKLLHEELRFRVGQTRSKLALVLRYAARCEAFEAQRLRDMCDAAPRNAERLLTLDMARYLFDAGLSPLIDATVGALRPDILHLGRSSLFYVEAKQYAGDHPSTQIRGAVVQVWGTWARLRRLYPSREAFLVIFRRSGPWVEIPRVLRHDDLRLYIVVADLSLQAGSRERDQPITFSEAELQPQRAAQE